MPNVIVIAGANGAGKSTLAPSLLRDEFGIVQYVNADTIAQGLAAFAPEAAALEAGKVMLAHLKELAQKQTDFAFETTLASRFYARWLSEQRQSNNYRFHLVFLYLRTVELAIERVRSRVRMGGHDIAAAVVRRRYARGLENFFRLYQPIADGWRFYEVSAKPFLLASGEKTIENSVGDVNLWNSLKKTNS